MSCESDASSSSSACSWSTEYDFDLRESISYLCGILRNSLNNGGGVKEIGSLTLTYGCTNQSQLSGKYAGVQCTTMALAAIVHNTTHPKWTPKKINTILSEGNRLHTFLRDESKLSSNTDGKIAVEDFPFHKYIDLGKVFGMQSAIKLRQKFQNVFTTKPEGFEEFLTINEYLEKWKPVYTNRCGFLITLGQSSYAIILKKKGTAVLFDSHGHLKINGEIIKEKAGVLKFPSIQSLHEFILSMYGPNKQAVIAPVHVSFGPRTPEKKVSRKACNESHVYKPYIPEEKVIVEAGDHTMKYKEEAIDDTSPYIGLFGGG